MNFNILFHNIILISNGLGVNIGNIKDQKILDNLKLSDWILDVIRMLGMMVFQAIGSIINYIYTCFNEILMIDFSNVVDLGFFKTDLLSLSIGVVGMVAVVMTVINMITLSFKIEMLKSIVITTVAIACFGTFTTYVNSYKDLGVEQVQSYFTGNVNMSLSERIFHQNCFDMLASLENNNLTEISDKIPINGIDLNSTISKYDLQGKVKYNIDGTRDTEDLSDGVLNSGWLEERYYRYSVSFMYCIFSGIVIGVIYFFSMFKVAYVGWEMFHTQLYGPLVMAIGSTKLEKVKIIYTSFIQNAGALILTACGVQVFGLIMNSVFDSQYHILTKIVLLFVGGLVTILGSGAINRALGIDDGTSFMFRSMMLTRMASRGFNKAKNGLNKLKDNVTPDKKNKKEVPKNDFNGKVHGGTEPLRLTNNEGEEKESPLYGGDGMSPQDNVNGAYLNNKDGVDIFYGGENMAPTSSVKQWDDKRSDKVDNFKSKYADLMKKKDSQGQTFPYEKDGLDNKVKGNEDNKSLVNDKPHAKLPYKKSNFGEMKTYADYKRDCKNGDYSFMKPNSTTKGLPDWWNNQDSVKSATDDIDAQELMKELQALGGGNKKNDGKHNEFDYDEFSLTSNSAYDDFLKKNEKK